MATSKAQTLAQTKALSKDQHFRHFIEEVSGRALVMMESACQGQHDIAKDIVQESFVSLHNFYINRPPAEWTPLFYKILNNKLIDWKRKEQRQNHRFGFFKSLTQYQDDLHDEEFIADDASVNPAQLLNQHITINEIKTAVKELPLRQQQAFMLRAWQELDTQTTAQIMQCSTGSVKTHYHRALLHLRQSLSHLSPDHEGAE